MTRKTGSIVSTRIKTQDFIRHKYPALLAEYTKIYCGNCYFRSNELELCLLLPVTSSGEPCPYLKMVNHD